MESLRIYIVNIAKPYDMEQAGYTGAWFQLPVTIDEIKEKIGIEKDDDMEIADYELPFSIDINTPLWEINALCHVVQELDGSPIYFAMKELQEKWFSSFEDFLDHKDDIICYTECCNLSEAAYELLKRNGKLQAIPEELRLFFAFDAYADYLATTDEFLETAHGIFYYKH